MDKPTKRTDSCYQAIDLGRFLCAVLVVAIHFSPFPGGADAEGTPQYVLNYFAGRIPVPFYFLCSGFFAFRGESPDCFCIERPKKSTLKLLRLYLTWTIIYLPLNISEFQYDEAGLNHAILVYLRNLFFTGSYLHLWYLNASAFGMAMVTLLLYSI